MGVKTNGVGGDSTGTVQLTNYAGGNPKTILSLTTVGSNINSGFAWKRVAPTYGVSVAIDASLGNEYVVTATDGVAFTVANPTNATTGQRISIRIRNTSGGVLGAVTWDTLYKLAAWTSPATANSRAIDFQYDGTNWVEVSRTPADVPN
jgi:hypothetical protein